MESIWVVKAVYCPGPKEVRKWDGRGGFVIETAVRGISGQTFTWKVRADTEEAAREEAFRSFCLRGNEKDFSICVVRVDNEGIAELPVTTGEGAPVAMGNGGGEVF